MFALKLDTLNLQDRGLSPSEVGDLTALPVSAEALSPENSSYVRSSGGKRTHDFFSSTSASTSNSSRPTTPSGTYNSVNNEQHEFLSAEPEADDPESQLSRSASASAALWIPIKPPSRYPSLLQKPTSSSQRASTASQQQPVNIPRVSSPTSTTSPPKPRSIPHDGHENSMSGQVLAGKYHIHSLIGSGAFSKVVLASLLQPLSDHNPRSPVAIKLIHKATTFQNQRMQLAVLRETEVLKHIRHPSLVQLLDSFDTPDYECLVLEHIGGGEMFDTLAKHHHEFTEAFVRRVFSGLLDVVKWMHSINLVHRDIKLENILLTAKPFPLPQSIDQLPNPLVKLSDFGLSRFITPSEPLLRTRCGSEEYAAPEIILGQAYDGRLTDTWALGIVLFTLLTGAMPFVHGGAPTFSPRMSTSSTSRRAYLMRIAKAEYYWPSKEEQSTLPFPISKNAQRLTDSLLQRDPSRRASLEAVWEHDEWLNGGPAKIETRDWAGQVWHHDDDKNEVLCAEVEPL